MDLKALIAILETLETQAASVEDKLEQWTTEVKNAQSLIFQLLDGAAQCGFDTKRHYDRCQ